MADMAAQKALRAIIKRGIVIEERVVLLDYLGRGGYGTVYSAIDQVSGEMLAVKTEQRRQSNRLRQELKIYQQLSATTGAGQQHVAKVRQCSTIGEFNLLVMERLGPSLLSLMRRQRCGHFSVVAAATIAKQLLTCLERLHAIGYIHRDLKPANIVTGATPETRNTVYLIDYGLAARYDVEGAATPTSRCGTANFASINTHKRQPQSRRDDLESLGYVLIYLCKGAFSWPRVTTEPLKWRQILAYKEKWSSAELCADLPLQFAWYLDYCRNLGYYEQPDYDILRALFDELLQECNAAHRINEIKID